MQNHPKMTYSGVLAQYGELLDIPAHTQPVTLLEGNTPLIPMPRLAQELGGGFDLWVKFEGLNPTGSFKDRGMTVAISEAVGRGVQAVICASTGNTAASAAAYAARADRRAVVIIPQGYDPEDLEAGLAPRPAHRKKLRIAHAGTFYAGRTPAVLLQALHNIFQASPQLRGRIELTLIGNARAEDQLLVNRLGLQNDVNFTGYLEHKECVKQLMDSDILWFILDNPYQSPGKLYEYIGTRKPILASVVEGHVKQLILESKAGICLPLNDGGAHEQALLEMFAHYERNDLKMVPAEFARRYNRLQLTGELARQFETLMDIDKNAFVRREEQVA